MDGIFRDISGISRFFRFGAREGEPAGAVSRSSSAARPDAGTVRRVRPSLSEERRENRASSAGTAFPSRGATGKPDLHRFRRLGEGAAKFSWSDWFRDRTFPFSGEPSGPPGAGERRGAAGWVPSGKMRRPHPILCRQKYPPFRADFDSRNFPVSNLPRAFPPLPFPGAVSPGRAPFAKTPLIFQFPRDSCMILLGFSQNRSHFYSVKRRQTHCLKAEKIKSQWKSTAGNT